MKRILLLTSAMALTSALTAGAASAQAVDPPAAPPATSRETVVITAERREQDVQEIPIAVNVIGSDELTARGTTDVRDLPNLVPGVQVLEVGQQPGVFIRGVGSAVANIGQDPAASFNVNGVPLSRPIGINASMFDVERVEVLKGPQGTLYGRSSTAGAINVLSKRPGNDFGGSASVRLGDYNLVQLEAGVDLPVSDQLSFRVSGQSIQRDGYISSGADDADSTGARVRALWEPTDDISILATFTTTEIGGVGPGDVPGRSPTNSYLDEDHPWRIATNDPSLPPVASAGFPAFPVGASSLFLDGQFGNSVPGGVSSQSLHADNYTVELNWDLGAVTLTALPAYINTRYNALTYNGGFRQKIFSEDEQSSLEVRLASNETEPLQWLVGAFYMVDEQFGFNDIHSRPTTRGITSWPLDLETYAVFGQATYSVLDNLRLTAGVRYTSDTKTSDKNCFATVGLSANVPLNSTSCFTLPGAALGASDTTWEYTSYRVGVDFDLTPDTLIYFNVSDAYKPGGDNLGLPTGPAGPASYVPEHLTAYHLGTKNELMNGELILNAEAWYWNWDDLQGFGIGCVNVASGPPSPPFCPLANTAISGITKTLGTAINYGVEASTFWRPTDNDTFSLNVSYNIGRYDDARTFDGIDISKTETIRTPTWSGTIGYDHDFPLASGAIINVGLNDRFSGKQTIALPSISAPTNRVVEDGWHLLGANLDYTSPDGSWTVGLWAENINEDDHTVFSARTPPGGLWLNPTAPRTFGVRLNANF